MSNYLISISDNTKALKKVTIHDPKSKLKVTVFDVIKSTFTPNKGEIQYFVTAGKNTFAFETEGFKKHKQILILQMISRYCVYLGLFEAQIHSTLPFS